MIRQRKYARSKVFWRCVRSWACSLISVRCRPSNAYCINRRLRAELVDGADFLCIRELTGGMYFGEKYQDNDKAYDTNMYTRPEIERILKVGFEYAMKRNKHLTVVDKANVLASSRLWRQIAQEMAPSYPEVTTDYMYVDNAAMRMIQEPKFFDVMVTENTFGDILTDEGSCISGSMACCLPLLPERARRFSSRFMALGRRRKG